MKIIPWILVLGLWSVGVLAAGDRYQLQVDGLACPFCAYGIEKKLSRLAGVEQVTTDVANSRITVQMTEGGTLEELQAKQAVKAAGFTLRSFTHEKVGQ